MRKGELFQHHLRKMRMWYEPDQAQRFSIISLYILVDDLQI